MVLDFDLNDPPPCGDHIAEITSLSAAPQELQDEPPLQSQPQAVVDLEAIDDDVVPSSPRRFYEARSRTRRNHAVMAVPDEEIDRYKETIWFPLSHNKRKRTTQNQKDTYGEYYSNLEFSKHTKVSTLPPKNRQSKVDIVESHDLEMPLIQKLTSSGPPNQIDANNTSTPPELFPSVPPQVVPVFNCPVCLGQLSNESTTKCGHIFCEKCIKSAIAAQKKCPTCRRKLTMRDTFRIYLPAAS